MGTSDLAQNDRPLITVAITCFNAEETIGRAIESVIGQNWAELEVIVIDDCSTDQSRAVVARYCERNSWIAIYQNPVNSGVAYSRQRAIDLASGEFLAFLDDDDEALPDRLQIQYGKLVQAKAEMSNIPTLCFGDRIVENGRCETRHVAGIGRSAPARGINIATFLLVGGKRPANWGAAGAGTLFASVSDLKSIGFDPQFSRAAEVDLLVRAAIAGYAFVSPEHFPVILQHVTHGREKSPFRRCKSRYQLLQKHRTFLAQQGLRYRAAMRFLIYVITSYVRYSFSHLLPRLFHENGRRGACRQSLGKLLGR
ncbi:glycosyltransferase family 2 protein [Rhizobium bangladeshense]|uniref:glycosyltransferase family 2 protein n=1 Tax=Rhizobium bangladeshense TaxID=1138189 RepID=UPI0007E56915|nr:glycosyltransferase family 2 protein [Rhizobium bangladeshense]